MAKKQFKAESKRLLDLMINSIYTNKEIFLRELISNASDALDKRWYISLTDAAKRISHDDLMIKIERDPNKRQLVIEDSGIGMDEKELESNLGTIARSGSADFQKKTENAEEADKTAIIGQFGVGFYSAFMVAKHITVETRSLYEDTGWRWESSGEDGYTISPIEKETIGTRIILELKDDNEDIHYSEYLDEYTIQNLIRKYSDYIRYPIRMLVTEHIPDPTDKNKTIETQKETTLNSMIPLWKKSKNEIKAEDYNAFYKSKFNDWQDPQKILHFTVEGNVSYTALLFIPSKAPYDFYNKEFESGIQLYSRGVFIMDKAKDLIPECYRFVKGLVDSEDLNLNISREILQQDTQVKTLAKSLDQKITNALQDMLKENREEYEQFFDNFGLNFKYSIYQSFGADKDKLQNLLLYRTDKEQKYVTLKEYCAHMKEGQKDIYFVSGSSMEEIAKLPVMATIREKGFEVLCFTDAIDEFVIRMMQSYEEHPFKSIVDSTTDFQTEEEKKELQEKQDANKDMLAAMKTALGEKVKEVRISSRLKDDPVCISSDEGMSIEMEKVLLQNHANNGMRAVKVLEINPRHPIFSKLQNVYKTEPDKLGDYADILYDQALLIEGLPISDPSAYAKKIIDLMIAVK